MSKHNPENPPYITISTLFGVHHVTYMEWDTRDGDGDYKVSKSVQIPGTRDGVDKFAREWAEREGVEVR